MRKGYLSYCRNLGWAKGMMREQWPNLNEEEKKRIIEMSGRFLANMQKELDQAAARRRGAYGKERV